MIDEENVNQAIFEYAGKKYGKQSKELFQGYIDEFPEKDWELPDETWLNNFLAWLFFNKYPYHWIDWMCKHYGLKERLKKEKIRGIENKIVNDLPQIVLKLPEKSKEHWLFVLSRAAL